MKRKDVISEIKRFFTLDELCCPHVSDKYEHRSWQFFSTELLHTLLVVRRDILQVPLYANGHGYTQRGLRCNQCKLNRDRTDRGEVVMSAHSMGRAIDLVSPKMSARQMREKIEQNADKLPYNVRIERDVTWLHIDVYDSGEQEKITYFNG